MLSLKEAAKTLGCSERTVRRMVAEKKLVACRLGKRKLTFHMSDLVECIDANLTSPRVSPHSKPETEIGKDPSLKLTTRALKVLDGSGIKTIEDLARVDDERLKYLKAGAGTMRSIKGAVMYAKAVTS